MGPRSDIYALGCVLYEMLGGEPPFSGRSAQSILARHRQDTPPPLHTVRPGLPPAIEASVECALAKVPADRFPTASAFAASLAASLTAPAVIGERPGRRNRWLLLGLGVGTAAIAAIIFAAAPKLDTSLYMVLPFRHRAESAPMLLNGDQCESLLYDALARWHGVRIVDPLWVADARSRRPGSVRVKDGVAIARQRLAGRVVMGEVWQFQDTIHVRGLLYDAAGNQLLREHSVRIAPDLSDAQARFQELADSLLIGGGAAGTPPGGAGRLSLPAWREFQEGFAALQRWDLDSAKAKLKQALIIDPTYGTAQLWLALVLDWAGEEPKTWKTYAAGALASDDSLTPRDRILGQALLALASDDYPQACQSFGM